MTSSHFPIKALQKTGQVLSLLGEHETMRVADLATATGEPRSSIYRLLSSLREFDYVEPGDRRGEFRLGMRLLRFGGAVAARFDVRQAALPAIEALHETTGETVLLYVRRDDDAACIERIDGRWVQLEVVDVGGSLALHTGAGPPTLLAYAGPEAIDDYLDRARLEPWTPLSPTTPRQVRANLERIRTFGIAISDQDVVLGVASIAVPVRDHSGHVVAAISLSGMRETLLGEGNRNRIEELVREAGTSASSRLGWSQRARRTA